MSHLMCLDGHIACFLDLNDARRLCTWCEQPEDTHINALYDASMNEGPSSLPFFGTFDESELTFPYNDNFGDSHALQVDQTLPSLNVEEATHFVHRRTGSKQIETHIQTGRRRDYTKQEKQDFEKWILSSPKPNRSQKSGYARTHNITDSQLNNLINNERRRGKSKQLPDDRQPEPDRITVEILSNAPSANRETSEVNDSISSFPVSDKNLRQSLSRKPSYSSIEEYLKSADEAVPLEKIQQASEKTPKFLHETPTISKSKYQGTLTPVESVDSSSSREPRTGQLSTRSSVSAATSVYSNASSAGRVRLKKQRREKYLEKYSENMRCRYCAKIFSCREEVVTHEKAHPEYGSRFYCQFCHDGSRYRSRKEKHEQEAHPQSFPCTCCRERFAYMSLWKDHETEYHCQPQRLWFCMLDGHWEVEKCIFCEESLPSRDHYTKAHSIQGCNLPLYLRAFNTRHDVMHHMTESHNIPEHQLTHLRNEIDCFSLRLNISHKYGLWRCGYCGIIGADWDHRLLHIKDHWKWGGPEFTKRHPWSIELANLDNFDFKSLEQLTRGKQLDRNRPWNLYFHGYDIYEAELRTKGYIKCDTEKMDMTSPSDPNSLPPPSFFASLARGTKVLLNLGTSRL